MSRKDNLKELRANSIIVLDNFFSVESCNKILLQLNSNLWQQSTLITNDQNSNLDSLYGSSRTSETYFNQYFTDEQKDILLNLNKKIHDCLNINSDKMEEWQITKYSFGEKFDFHVDSGYFPFDACGDRDKTILLYLMPPIEGGETYFRALNLYVSPIQGRLVIWDNLFANGSTNYAMIHSGMPVKKGVKIILNTWVRQFSSS